MVLVGKVVDLVVGLSENRVLAETAVDMDCVTDSFVDVALNGTVALVIGGYVVERSFEVSKAWEDHCGGNVVTAVGSVGTSGFDPLPELGPGKRQHHILVQNTQAEQDGHRWVLRVESSSVVSEPGWVSFEALDS